ncbi:hypothetical protein TIFTF001_035738 [Ficus carica]|uniref:Uncharacterized protein n=1 Tax=Ficus carica TaxID=3494 RepID=A0AA88E232_FICCA|nr:hypothetical protein TIFTF001_035738 [Ficus carica]
MSLKTTKHMHGWQLGIFKSGCCGLPYEEITEGDIDGSLNSEYVCVFMDKTYGKFLTSNNGRIDSLGDKFRRTATVDFHDSEEFEKYIKAEEGRFNDANGITGFTTPTATASFSFHFDQDDLESVKINKGDESIRSEPRQEEEEEDDNGGESDTSGREAIHPESDDQEEDVEPLPERIRT